MKILLGSNSGNEDEKMDEKERAELNHQCLEKNQMYEMGKKRGYSEVK